MKLFELDWGWKFNLLLAILVLFICVISFDMINNWETKKRDDMVILFVGITAYVAVILAVTTPTVVTLFAVISLVVLCIAASVGVSDDFYSNEKAPWELWLIAFLSIGALVAAILWAYYRTDAGRYVGKKLDNANTYAKDNINSMKERRNREKQQRLALRKKSVSTIRNPMFDENLLNSD